MTVGPIQIYMETDVIPVLGSAAWQRSLQLRVQTLDET